MFISRPHTPLPVFSYSTGRSLTTLNTTWKTRALPRDAVRNIMLYMMTPCDAVMWVRKDWFRAFFSQYAFAYERYASVTYDHVIECVDSGMFVADMSHVMLCRLIMTNTKVIFECIRSDTHNDADYINGSSTYSICEVGSNISYSKILSGHAPIDGLCAKLAFHAYFDCHFTDINYIRNVNETKCDDFYHLVSCVGKRLRGITYTDVDVTDKVDAASAIIANNILARNFDIDETTRSSKNILRLSNLFYKVNSYVRQYSEARAGLQYDRAYQHVNCDDYFAHMTNICDRNDRGQTQIGDFNAVTIPSDMFQLHPYYESIIRDLFMVEPMRDISIVDDDLDVLMQDC